MTNFRGKTVGSAAETAVSGGGGKLGGQDPLLKSFRSCLGSFIFVGSGY